MGKLTFIGGAVINTAYTVHSTSVLHSNRLNNLSEDVALNNSGCERRSSLTLFIPRNVNIDRILSFNPPNFNYHKDCFVYIMHIISSIPTRDWDLIDRNGFTAINKVILQRRIHEYKLYISYLVSNGILEENRHYVPGKKSMGLKFNSRYQSELIPIQITKWTLIKSITGYHSNVNIEKTEEIHFLKKWFNCKIQVDLEGAQIFLTQLKEQEIESGSLHAQQAYNSRILPLLELIQGEYSFGVDNTGFRLHTNLTRTMKELRKYIKYDGNKLHSIDIVNSQPFLARPLFQLNYFNRNKIYDKILNQRLTTQANYPIMLVEKIERVTNQQDVINYLEMVTNGEFYEKFGEILVQNELFDGDIQNTSVRDTVKEITFATLYSPNTAMAYNSEVRVFSNVFPNVYEMIKLIKLGHGNHRAYSILLQRLEAELILDKICKRISHAYPQIPIFTIHDSIVTIEKYVPIVENFMKKIMRINVGASPMLKIETWE